MMFGDFMMGARSRLLPPSVPFRFFAAALVFHIGAWAFLALGADAMHGFVGGTGPLLAGLHLMTLGVLAMTAMGAGFQILPVATPRGLKSVFACRLAFVLFVPGVALVGHGFGSGQAWALHGGSTLAVAGLAVFGWLLGSNLRGVTDMKLVVAHLWTALACLLALAILGLLLILDWDSGLLPNRFGAAVAHAVLAGYGFMGMLAMGFSFILLPMFALAPPPSEVLGFRALRLAQAALLAGGVGALMGQGILLIAAALLGLGAVGLHLSALRKALKARMRKKFDLAFYMIFAAWALLPLSLLAGLAAVVGLWTEVTVPLFGFLLIFGWLLTFLTGVLQRIIPFLASMNSVRGDGKSILVSSLTPVWPLRLHAGLHSSALMLVSAGLLAGSPQVMRFGFLFGLAGAISFAAFGTTVWLRFRRHRANNTQR